MNEGRKEREAYSLSSSKLTHQIYMTSPTFTVLGELMSIHMEGSVRREERVTLLPLVLPHLCPKKVRKLYIIENE